MNIPRRLLAVAFALVLVLVLSAPVPHLSAQAHAFTPPTGPDGRIAITLVLTSGGTTPTLLRRAAAESPNVILLDSATVDAQQLSDAVFHLLILEAQDPQGRRRSNNAAQRIRADQPHPVYPWADEALVRLRSAARRPIDNARSAGQRYRTVQIWAPPLSGVRR